VGGDLESSRRKARKKHGVSVPCRKGQKQKHSSKKRGRKIDGKENLLLNKKKSLKKNNGKGGKERKERENGDFRSDTDKDLVSQSFYRKRAMRFEPGLGGGGREKEPQVKCTMRPDTRVQEANRRISSVLKDPSLQQSDPLADVGGRIGTRS